MKYIQNNNCLQRGTDMIIDFHAHTFPEKNSGKVIQKLGSLSHTLPFTDGSVRELFTSMKEAGVDYSVNLPVMTTVEQVEKVNNALTRQREELLSQGIITFGGMHPDYDNYKEELRRLKQSGIPGIKLHPAYQNVDLDDRRMIRIIDYASELGLIVLTHAGIDIGIHDHNYCSVSHILKVIDQVHPPRFVLAHLGNWGCWKDVEQDLAGAPVWLDTAFAVGPITPDPKQDEKPYLEENLSNEDFVRICRKHGVDRILFATDSPWQNQKDYIGRVRRTGLNQQEQELIFSENARKLLSF